MIFLQRRGAEAETALVTKRRWLVALWFLLSAVFGPLTACSSSGRAGPARDAPQPHNLLEEGRRYASVGEHLRAEQYFTAAVGQGASWDDVIVPLVEVCVQSGRLESALGYVRRHAKRHPLDPALHHLSAALALALRKWDIARNHVQHLEQADRLPAESLLFLGDYFQDRGTEPDRARRYYAAYLRAAPQGQRAPSIRVVLEGSHEEDQP